MAFSDINLGDEQTEEIDAVIGGLWLNYKRNISFRWKPYR